MNGLALCAGIGGLELGLKLALGDSYRTVCCVEREAYPAACLVKRMEEGFLDKAPIWDDLRTFNGRRWRGKVDIVTAGFPCQPFSAAGKQKHESDPRHLWPEIARIIKECSPALVFLENVAARAFKEPYSDLRRMGFKLPTPYSASAAEMGAGHIRRRVFVFAYHDGNRLERNPRIKGTRQDKGRKQDVGQVLSNGYNKGRVQQKGRKHQKWKWFSNTTQKTISSYDESLNGRTGQHPSWLEKPSNGGRSWWASEPRLERLVHGVPNRVDRDRALGNAVVPVVAAKAFLALSEGIMNLWECSPASLTRRGAGVRESRSRKGGR